MARLQVNQTIQTLANVGVIAGIAFLALEIHQNNELMEAEARFNRLSLTKEAFNILSTNGELAEINLKVHQGSELTDLEEYRWKASTMRYFTNMEWIFRELAPDSDERRYARRSLIGNLANPRVKRFFHENKELFAEDFVTWIEDRLLEG